MSDYLKRAYAEIHLDRAKRNIEKIRTLLKGNTELMAVVKANAYGHDDGVLPLYFQSLGIKYFAVSNIHEAENLRKAGVTGEILVLGYTSPEYCKELYDYNITATVVSYEHAEEMSRTAKQPVRCHAAIDTGMGRIGIRTYDETKCADEIEKISKLQNIALEGIFTHLAAADSYDEENVKYTESQRDFFLSVKKILSERGISLKHTHYLNSAGGTFYADSESTLARFGIMLYGLYPDVSLKLPFELEPVMELKAEVGYVNKIKKDSYVSYGRTFCAESDMTLAVLTIGYADGYSRLLSSKAEVLIKGKRVKIVGRICMDQLMIDVTGTDVKPGDIATLIGIDGDEKITADELASLYGTIGYEVVCGISKRVPRVIMNSDQIITVREY